MPPIPDRKLEERILQAALRLWRARGEKGLTLRAVARAAGTTTPTVYKRFHNKDALRLALAFRVREELNAELLSSASIEEANRRYLRYAEENPHEYELLRLSWGQFQAPDRPHPARVWLLTQLARRFGGEPQEYARVHLALLLLCHGASTLLSVEGDHAVHEEMRKNCAWICDKLIENVGIFRTRPREGSPPS